MNRGLALRRGAGLLLAAAVAGGLWSRCVAREPRAVTAPVATPQPEPADSARGAGAPNPAPSANDPTDPAPAPTSSGDSEQGLMEEARQRLESEPAASLALIERADARFGTGSEPRRALEIDAHVRLGRIGRARSLADQFYRSFPGSSEIARIERLTGYHPRPYGPPGR